MFPSVKPTSLEVSGRFLLAKALQLKIDLSSAGGGRGERQLPKRSRSVQPGAAPLGGSRGSQWGARNGSCFWVSQCSVCAAVKSKHFFMFQETMSFQFDFISILIFKFRCV